MRVRSLTAADSRVGGTRSATPLPIAITEKMRGPSMRPQERSPRCWTRPARWNTLLPKNRGDRRPRHVMSNIFQGALNPRIAPRRVLGRHPHNQTRDLLEYAGASWPPSSIRPFPRNQLTMPAKNRVGRDQRSRPLAGIVDRDVHRDAPSVGDPSRSLSAARKSRRQSTRGRDRVTGHDALDDGPYALQATIPHLTPSALHRLFSAAPPTPVLVRTVVQDDRVRRRQDLAHGL